MNFATDPLRISPLPWQRWLLIHSLELLPGERFRFRTVLILVARQNGKTTIVEVKNLWKMFVLGVPLVIGTAQNLDISEESWDHAVEMVESIPELAAELKHVDKTNGKKALKLVSGSRWKIAAASRRGGRGLSGDDVNLDELREHQNWLAWGAVTKTTMARPKAQIWAFSNAGDDSSIVLNSLQKKGRAAAEHPGVGDSSLGHFEWSAPDEVKCDCGRPDDVHSEDCMLLDRRYWAMANPALGYTITEDTLTSALSTDPEPIFRTECLCQRVPNLVPDWSVIGKADWMPLVAVADQEDLAPVAIAVDVTPERSHASIAVAGRVNGLMHVEIAEHRRGTGWVVGWLAERVNKWQPCAVVIAKNSPAGSLIPEAEAAGIEIVKPSLNDEAQACGLFMDAVAPEDGEPPTLRHRGQAEMDNAVKGAVRSDLGDGAWRWSRKSAMTVISPLVAATHAAWGQAKFGPPADYDVLESVF